MTINSIINRLFIVYTIMKPAIDRLSPITFDGAGRIYLLLLLFVLIANIKYNNFWSTFKVPSILIWSLWSIYASTIWTIIGINNSDLSPLVFLLNKVFLSLFVLFISYYESKSDPKNFSRVILYAFILYTLIGILFHDVSMASDRSESKMGNNLPLNALCMFVICAIRYIKGWDDSKMFFFSLILFTSTIFLAATRKALVAEFILILFLILIRFKISNFKNLLPLAIIILVLYLISGYIINSTEIGNRFLDINSAAETYNTSDYAILNILGDRAYFYINGWELFTNSPIFGIGLRNFGYLMDTHLPIHSEFIVQLCETGIIGSILYILFYIYFCKRISKTKKYKTEKNVCIFFYGWIIVLMFLSLTTWTYEFPRYFCITGFILGYCENRLMKFNSI